MSDAKKSNDGKAKRPPRRPRRTPGAVDPLERAFGPGVTEEPSAPEPSRASASGPNPGLACGGENCLLRPAADLVGKFALSLAGRAALGRAAGSGLELLKALRDFLDEEIALAGRAAGKSEEATRRYEKIPVE